MTCRMNSMLIAAALVCGAVGIGGCGGDSGSSASEGSDRIPQPSAAQLAAAGLEKLPVAPDSARIDLSTPSFSDPTGVTNPLFPISKLKSAVLTGRVDGKPFKTETTLLPQTEVVQWPPDQVEVLLSQYVAYLDGRIEEVALDRYAQADDGSVWYFGEDVSDYKDGVVVVTEGTWLAGRDGPAAMIMPGKPRVGDVYRSENVPGAAFEEVTVKALDRTVPGPHGPVRGAMIGSELHAEGTREDKTFAPGYGEFFTAGGGDVEAMALAVPADKLPGPIPGALELVSAGADRLFNSARSRDWPAAAATVRRMSGAWKALREGQVPPRLVPEMRRALGGLHRAISARDPGRTRQQAIAAAQAALDLELRYRPPAEVDRGRFDLWARQILVDAAAHDAGAVAGDVATLKLIRDRFAHTLGEVDVTRLDSHLLELEAKVTDEDLDGAATEAARLRATLAKVG